MIETNDTLLINDYLSGMCLSEICKKHEIKVHIIYKRLKQHGILAKSNSLLIMNRIAEKFPQHDFSNSVFINELTYINATCRKHGAFKCRPVNALRKYVSEICNCCQKEQRSNQFNFINTILKLEHIDYSKVEYKNARTKVQIICKLHGEKWVLPGALKQGSVCKECGISKGINNRSKHYKKCSKSEFLNSVLKRQDYHNYIYNAVPKEFFLHSKIQIECKFHGTFNQRADEHLKGKGCFKCFCSLKKSYSKTAFKEMQKGRPLKLYIICIYNSNELFYKVGLTFQNMNARFRQIKARYNIYPLFIIQDMDSDKLFSLEKRVLKYFIEHKLKYKPKKKFSGDSECFKIDELKLKQLYSFILNSVG